MASKGKGQEGAKRKRGMFSRELRLMMYGFGDDICPLQESVALMEDMMIEYVTDMVHKAQEVSSKRGKLSTEDVMFLVRKDIRKYARVKELLSMNEELKRARKVLNEDLDEQKLAALEAPNAADR